MGLLLFMLVIAIAFTWLVVRSIRAGYGRGLFWLAWFLVGLSVCLSLRLPLPRAEKLFLQLWAYSVIGIPVWWAIAALRRASRRS